LTGQQSCSIFGHKPASISRVNSPTSNYLVVTGILLVCISSMQQKCGRLGQLPRGATRAPVLRRNVIAAAQTTTPDVSKRQPQGEARSHETDIVVIGSGIGGLSCAALLARYGHKVTMSYDHHLDSGERQL